jgi:hypothetical protein
MAQDELHASVQWTLKDLLTLVESVKDLLTLCEKYPEQRDLECLKMISVCIEKIETGILTIMEDPANEKTLK